jgi:hypothetical protein
MKLTKKLLAPLILVTMLAVILCGSFCLVQANMHSHCDSAMSHVDQSQVNSPEAKLDLKSHPTLLAVIDPKDLMEACRTKNVVIKPQHFSMLEPTLIHEQQRQLQHTFTGSKDFI